MLVVFHRGRADRRIHAPPAPGDRAAALRSVRNNEVGFPCPSQPSLDPGCLCLRFVLRLAGQPPASEDDRTHRNAGIETGSFRVGIAEFEEVEDVRRGARCRVGVADGGRKVRVVPDPAACDHRNGDRSSHRGDQLDVISGPGAVPIDRVEEYLARTQALDLTRPLRWVSAGRDSAAIGKHFVAAVRVTPSVDRGHDALRAEAARRPFHQRRILQGGGIQGYLVRARAEPLGDVLQ